jgi:uncharacterized protein YndB with AHSA1/START domain
MDEIEREVFIAAPVERVWEIVTDARHVAGWFSETAEVDLRVGGRMVLAWKEYGTFLCVVERVEPPRLFAFRGAYEPDVEPAPGNSTLVEFTLRPEADGTRLRVVESGFASLDLPEEERRRRREDNIDGWRQEFGELVSYVDAVAG